MDKLDAIVREIKNCKKCGLCRSRKTPVPGSGSPNAAILFVGEAPGYNEDLSGLPFVGAAGKVLDEMLAAISLKRSEIYIANILKCRPPNNRDPTAEEMKACTPYLDRQISAINPKVICPLGNFAANYILTKFGMRASKIGAIHGKVFSLNTLTQHLRIIPMYHPASATYNSDMKPVLRDDFRVLASLAL